jgi:DNA-binding CsgD family transcriptional regulator
MGTELTTTPADGLLERSAQLEGLDDRLAAIRADGRGRLVLIAGEAGVGKTSLVRRFCDVARTARVLWGACDTLYTPRPLGPLVDIADEAGGELAAVVGDGPTPGVLVAALARDLRRQAPAIVVIEDVHWADDATLDVLRLLARRIESMPALVVATYRNDELDPAHQLRVVLGELRSHASDRVALPPLSRDAVAQLAAPAGVDDAELFRRTAGNPFFVTESLAATDGHLPDTVRDAVLARAAPLDAAARTVLDAVAVVPQHAELWLLEALADGDLDGLDACLASGMLRAERDGVGFRHEIARAVIEESLAPHRRRALHRRALVALADGRPDLARLAHHADAAHDPEAVLRYASAAGDLAARLGSHGEAAAQFARALRYADALAPERRAELLARRSYECYLIDRIPEAIAAREAALREHSAAGDTLREGDARRWLSRLAWFSGDNAAAEAQARQAVELLEPLAPGRELAMAYSNMAQLRMLADDVPAAKEWGGRAIALAERLGETEILVHALNNVGTTELRVGSSAGGASLERSLELALRAGLQEHVARAYTNLSTTALSLRDYASADRWLEAGIAYCEERDLDAWLMYMTGFRARSELERGRLDAAAASAHAVLDRPGVPTASRITPLAVLGRLRARRGDPDPWSPLDEALELARETGELQRVGPVAAARAEALWLGGDLAPIARETATALVMALERGNAWCTGELVAWRHRAGVRDDVTLEAVAEPYALELRGAGEAASEAWAAIGCPFEAALALAHAEAEPARRRALAELQRIGARPAAARVARALREGGARNVRSGPRAATRENPAGLTARELEVLELIAAGLRNAEIAERLFLSAKTVAHHVSAVLRKLGVQTRSQAGAEAARLGIVER